MSTTAELRAEITAKQAEIAQLEKELLVPLQALFAEGTRVLFADHPCMQSFSWPQYTDYFNDGSPCEFAVHTYDSDVLINGEEVPDATLWVDTGERERNTYGGTQIKYREDPNPDYDAALTAAQEAVQEFISNLDEDHLKDTFGDHVLVTVTADGASTESYEHE